MINHRSSLSDTPLTLSTNDFGTEKYVEGLVRFIEHSAAPITIALKGEWGSGKTSLMNRLYNDLCSNDKDFIGIKINTWEYSMLATPEETVVKIIVHLVNSLSDNDPNTSEKLINFTKNAANFVLRGLREWGKGIVPGAGIAMEAANVPTEIFSSDGHRGNVTLSDLKDSLTQAISKSLGDSKKGVIIFVDDLDRLNPPLAVQILELLKNIFTLDNCIFVLAIDYDVVVKGLEPKFGPYKPENDREFRSFFDKIIQVPFSLPVSNYRPMEFVFDSLVSINYITRAERNIPIIQKSIEKIVVSSVGKNPRAIKRLINTLSLLDCISKCASNESTTETIEYKIINFAIVSLQVCYPKIYDMLLVNPLFAKWDTHIAAKLGLHLSNNESGNIEEINGEIILDALCDKEIFYDKHHTEILELISLINHNAALLNPKSPGEAIQELLFRSSVTNVSTSEPIKFDRKDLIYKLHDNVWSYITSKLPNLKSQFKRNTGNGGYYIYLNDDSYFEVVFQPHEGVGKIALRIFLDVWNKRPERLKDVPYSEVISDPAVLNVIKPMNEVVKRLTQYGNVEGRTFEEKYRFNDIIEEYKFREGELWDAFSGTLDYWINVKNVADFEDSQIIRAIGDLIIGAYEMNTLALQIK